MLKGDDMDNDNDIYKINYYIYMTENTIGW